MAEGAWEIAAGVCVAFAVAMVFSALDVRQTIVKADYQVNIFSSWSMWFLLLLTGGIGGIVFLLTCLYPSSWVKRVVGQDIDIQLLRALVVGMTVTVIIRSRLTNLGDSGAGVDLAYSTIKNWAIKQLLLKTHREIRKHAVRYGETIAAAPKFNATQFESHWASSSSEMIDSTYHANIPRRDKLKGELKKIAAGSAIPTDLSPQSTLVSWSMRYCGIGAVQKSLDEYIKTII